MSIIDQLHVIAQNQDLRERFLTKPTLGCYNLSCNDCAFNGNNGCSIKSIDNSVYGIFYYLELYTSYLDNMKQLKQDYPELLI